MKLESGVALCLIALVASCATTGKDNPAAMCQSAVKELSECAAETKKWQAQEITKRPQCIAEGTVTPGAAAILESGNRSLPDDPERKAKLQRVAIGLEMANRFLQREKPVEAQVLLRRVERRCADLP